MIQAKISDKFRTKPVACGAVPLLVHVYLRKTDGYLNSLLCLPPLLGQQALRVDRPQPSTTEWGWTWIPDLTQRVWLPAWDLGLNPVAGCRTSRRRPTGQHLQQ